MKQYTIILFLFFVNYLNAQQSEINGIISIFNSESEHGKREYVAGATVIDEFKKQQQAATDYNGIFKLIFVKVDNNIPVNLIVEKRGLQVVNINEYQMVSAVTGQNGLVRISMAKPKYIAEYRQQIYRVGKTEAEKNLTLKLKKLSEQIAILQYDTAKNKSIILNLQKEYRILQASAAKIDERVEYLTRHYARLNLDDAAPLFRKAFTAFKQGDPESALQILKEGDLDTQKDKILLERKIIDTIRNEAAKLSNEAIQRDSIQLQRTKDIILALGLKAEVNETISLFDSTENCFKSMLELDSTNSEIYSDYALFLGRLNKTDSSILYLEKAIKLSNKEEFKANAYSNLGNLLLSKREIDKSKEAHLYALNICKQLFKNSKQIKPTLARCELNLGAYYHTVEDYSNSEKIYLSALTSYKELAQEDTLQELYPLAISWILMNLGNVYSDLKVKDTAYVAKSEEMYLNSLSVLNQLKKRGVKNIEHDIAMLEMNLGNFYNAIKKTSKAEELFYSAITHYKNLSKNNPARFEPALAKTQMNFSVFLVNTYTNTLEKSKLIEAERLNASSLEIYNRLVKNNPAVFKYDLRNLLGNISWCSLFSSNFIEAESAAINALAIDPSQTWIKMNLAHALLFQNRYSEAEKVYMELKPLKDEDDLPYPITLIEDLETLEKTGIKNKYIQKIIERLKE